MLLSMLTAVFVFAAPAAAYDDDYPTSIDGCRLVSGGSLTTCNLKEDTQDKWVDPWGEYNRECTSFVAWRLASRNGYIMPFHDNASGWKADADARKIPIDNTPAVGAVAWFNYDHIAWVEGVGADRKTVTIEEYNYDYDGHYNERTVPTDPNAKGGVAKFIHFKDLDSDTSSPTNPLADGNYISHYGNVYRIAGGAPLYVPGDDAARLPGWTSNKPVSDEQWASLRSFPGDGTYLSDVQTGAVYITAGGAPMYISGGDAPYLPGWAHALPVPHWDFVNWQHLRQYPADGYYLRDVQSGFVYNTAGGVPFYVTAQDAPALPSGSTQLRSHTGRW